MRGKNIKTSEKKINGIVYHKVIPESDGEYRLAEEFLIPEGNAAFSDMGDSKRWRSFVKATSLKREDDLNKSIYDMFKAASKDNQNH